MESMATYWMIEVSREFTVRYEISGEPDHTCQAWVDTANYGRLARYASEQGARAVLDDLRRKGAEVRLIKVIRKIVDPS